MIRQSSEQSPRKDVSWNATHLLVAIIFTDLGYWVGCKLGFALTAGTVPVAFLWPPNAIVLAALLIAPAWFWPLLLAAVLPVHLLVEMQGGVPLPMVLGWFVSNSFQAWLGAYVYRRLLPGRIRLDSVHAFGVFFVWATLFATFVATFLDAAFVSLNHWGASGFAQVLEVRFCSNVLATMTIVPLIVSWSDWDPRTLRTGPGRHLGEIAGLVIGVLAMCLLALVVPTRWPGMAPVVLFLTLPILLWAAFDFGVRGMSAALLPVTVCAVWGLARSEGPYMALATEEGILSLQVFLFLSAVALFILAVVSEERRRAAGALQESDARIALASAGSKLGFWTFNEETGELWLDAECATMFGTPEVAGEAPEPVAVLRRSISIGATGETAIDPDARGESVAREFSIVGTDGVERVVASSARWMEKTAEDSPARIVGVARDITEQRRNEREMRERQEQLSHLARVGLIGQFTGAIVHEIGQPAGAILLNARVAQRLITGNENIPQPVAEIVEDIVRDSERSAEVIADLRRLLRRDETERHLLDVGQLVLSALELAHSDFVQHGVEVELASGGDLPRVLGNRAQLQQVLLNLFLNARDAMFSMPAGKRHLRVEVGRLGAATIHIRVADTGCGISPDHLGEVFEPYVTSKPAGVGLGLTISRTIVREHGGTLSAESSGSGAVMHLTLPVAP